MKAPYQLTPMHAWHTQNGAQTSVVDGWVRVLAYGDSQGEITAGNSEIGICDVTPLSKIDVQGKRSGELLQEIAGVPMPEVGGCASFMLKDSSKPAYVARLNSERYVVFANAGLRKQLYTRLADATQDQGCAHATDVTSAYAALQLVGPMAAALLKKLGSAPIDQIQTDHCVQTSTARVWSVLIHHQARQGSAWLLLVSRDFGQYVWESVLAAGQGFGIRPLGILAAQAITGMEEIDVAAL
jgi:heterotetrameric sarcosine oxidase gamma subunit